VLTPIILW